MSVANSVVSIPVDGRRASQESEVSLAPDEAEVLDIYRKAKHFGYADIAITVQDGRRVKLWLTEKMK